MTSIQRRAALLLVAALTAGSALAQAAAPVRVGSKIDTEGKLLGNMIVLVLEANGIKTENKASLGTIMLPNNLPSVSILEPTRTGTAVCASTLPAARALAITMAALRWIEFMVRSSNDVIGQTKELTITQTVKAWVSVGNLLDSGWTVICLVIYMKTCCSRCKPCADSYSNNSKSKFESRRVKHPA